MKLRKIKIALAMLLVSSILVGCSSKKVNAMGTVILSVNPSIAINYNKDGNVQSVEALNEDGKAIIEGFSGYEGKEAKLVIADLVMLIGKAGYLVDDIENNNRKITIELEDDSVVPNEVFVQDIASSIQKYLNSVEHKNVIRYKGNDQSDYLDFSDYFDTDYDVSDYDDTDYDDKKPVVPNKPVKDTDYSDYTDFDNTDYDDSDYSDYDESDYDDSDYDDSDYDDSDYDN